MRHLLPLALCLAGLLGLAPAGASDLWPRSETRPALDLDGTWQFRVDPGDTGELERWFLPEFEFTDVVRVPGCWDAQGVGEPAEKMFHNYVGKAWYRRSVQVPAGWAGKRMVLSVGGVHRYANVWVNGKHVKRHVGYVAPFEVDLTGVLEPGKQNTIAIRIDSKQDWEIDALTGAFDLIDYMDLTWGGIWSHVRLEARDEAYIDSAFVQPKVSAARAEVEVDCRAAAAAERKLTVEVLAPGGERVAEDSRDVLVPAEGSLERFSLPVPKAKLWSTNHPWLYRVRVTMRTGDRVSDQWEDRFGMREIEVRGPDIYLNGNRVFLHGYGDDTIYPETTVAPADPAPHRERFARIKAFGLNYVRHHSTVPVPEYFDAADEAGVLVQPELPIAYRPFLDRGLQSEAATQLYFTTWEAMIRRLRNHPSLFGWCMGNELYDSFRLAPELYDMAKRLDPTRPVYDTDGVSLAEQGRRTLDVLPVQFNVAVIPVLDNANKHEIAEAPTKPVISHEMGNFSTYPDLSDERRFQWGIRPFWLSSAREQLGANGLLPEAPRWLRNSSLLQAACFKLETEDLRWSPYSDGHALWLFQDYWTGTSGLVNSHFQVKGAGPAYYRRFLADTVLLARLPERCFTAGSAVSVPLGVSDFGEQSLVGRSVGWELLASDGSRLAAGKAGPLGAEKGLCPLGEASLTLPSVDRAEKLTFRMDLDNGDERIENEWSLWVFPRVSIPEAPEGVRIVRRLDQGALRWIAEGGRALLTRPEALLPAEAVTFEPAWWKGTPGADSHVGTVIYDHAAMRDFPHEGWCDLQFLRLQHNRPALLLDGLPLRKGTIVRAIDCHTGNRDKALMVEARLGRGAVLLTTLDLSPATVRARPEARWLLRGLLAYVASKGFRPSCELDVADLEKRVGSSPQLGSVARVEGFSRLVRHVGDVTQEGRYTLGNPRAYVIRGTDGTQALEWETAPVPAGPEETVCFAFSGGLGWETEPDAPFTLRAGDLGAITLGVTQTATTWTSPDGSLRLLYDPRQVFAPDSIGVFYLLVPRKALVTGQVLRLSVETAAAGSKRWMMLHPSTSVWAEEE